MLYDVLLFKLVLGTSIIESAGPCNTGTATV